MLLSSRSRNSVPNKPTLNRWSDTWKDSETMWAEFYTLGQNKGVCFRVAAMTMAYGSNLRICLRPEDVGKDEEQWFFVDMEESGRARMAGRLWSDVGCASERFEHFKEIPPSEAKKWLIPQ